MHAAAIANRIGDGKKGSLPPNLTPLRNPISPWDSECARATHAFLPLVQWR